MLPEPVLTAEDVRVWEAWRRTFSMHARTLAHRRVVDQAKRAADRALSSATSPHVAWSAGKDSTALTHLVRVGLGADVPAVSEKDDLDYPGEEAYVLDLASAWNLRLEIVRPPVSPMAWLFARRGQLSAGEDMHSKDAGLSQACFYNVMEQASEGHDVVFWGLRAEESAGRRANRTKRGLFYRVAHGPARCHPLSDWTGLDVFTYLQANAIEPLPVYRCCGWLPEHRLKPWLIRKSWWIPGAHAKHGQVAWLRRYWPSLYAKLEELAPDIGAYV